MSSDAAEEASLEGGSVKASRGGAPEKKKKMQKRSSAGGRFGKSDRGVAEEEEALEGDSVKA
jgi:hypothetical protein